MSLYWHTMYLQWDNKVLKETILCYCHTRVTSMTRIGGESRASHGRVADESWTSLDRYLGGLQGQSGSRGTYTQGHFQVKFSGELKV